MTPVGLGIHRQGTLIFFIFAIFSAGDSGFVTNLGNSGGVREDRCDDGTYFLLATEASPGSRSFVTDSARKSEIPARINPP